MDLKILELFSGIGGMHYAFQYSQLQGKVMAAMDINTVANDVYAFNHKNTCLMNKNIQKLSVKTLQKLNINTILMSPPCQPHTRVGQKRDIEDKRSDALNHICELLPQCTGVQYVLMENVKGFEKSQARDIYVEALKKSQFYFREFIISPTQFGIPNTRHRYYCLARKCDDFSFHGDKIWEDWPTPRNAGQFNKINLATIFMKENDVGSEFFLDEKVLKRRVWLMDIVTSDANNTMCFTKAYTHYTEGTGSIYCPLSRKEMQSKFVELKNNEEIEQRQEKDDKRLNLLRSLKLRYFTPREVARLMTFPETFAFPNNITNRQKYRLLGNSVNVCVVGELIKLMCTDAS